MMTINELQKLPVDIRRLVYSLDRTYRTVYNKVMRELNIIFNM